MLKCSFKIKNEKKEMDWLGGESASLMMLAVLGTDRSPDGRGYAHLWSRMAADLVRVDQLGFDFPGH